MSPEEEDRHLKELRYMEEVITASLIVAAARAYHDNTVPPPPPWDVEAKEDELLDLLRKGVTA